MLQIYVLHENAVWVEPLRSAFKARGLPYDEWVLDQGAVPFDAPPPAGVFYNRMSASSHTRGNRYAPELTHAVLNWLKLHDRRVVNGPRALYLEVSKVAQYAALQQAGIAVPRTAVANNRDAVIELARDFAPAPFVVKPNRGGKGLGVRLFASLDEARAYLDSDLATEEAPIDGLWLVQEYIEAARPVITRCEFVGGRFHYAVRVDTGGSFELCPADVCAADGGPAPPKFTITDDVDPALIGRYEDFLRVNDIEIAGIEFIRDTAGRIFTYDVNTNTNYNAEAEAAAGVAVTGMEAIANFLGAELAALTTGPSQIAAAE